MLATHYFNAIQQYLKNTPQYPTTETNLWLKRRFFDFIIVAPLYWITLGLMDPFMQPDLVWPCFGIVLGLLFIRGSRLWLGLLFGSIMHVWPVYLLSDLYLVAFYTLIPLVFYTLSHKLIGAVSPLTQVATLFKWIGLSCVFSVVLSLVSAYFASPTQATAFEALSLTKNTFCFLLGFLLTTPVALILDTHIPGKSPWVFPLQLNLLFVILTALLLFASFAPSSAVAAGFFTAALSILPFFWKRQESTVLAHSLLALFGFTFTALPSSAFLLEPNHWIACQALLITLAVLGLYRSTHNKQNKMLEFISTHKTSLQKLLLVPAHALQESPHCVPNQAP